MDTRHKQFFAKCVLLFAGIVMGAVFFAGIRNYTCTDTLGFSVWSNAKKVAPGYVLVAPYYPAEKYDKPGRVDLINTNGDVVHSWTTKYTTLMAYLQPNGHLFAAMTPPISLFAYPSQGSTGLLQELDWKGNVLWEYADDQMTHDFEVLDGGDIVYTRWHRAPQKFANGVQGGMQTATSSVWVNELVRVNHDKKVVWTWRAEDHLDPRKFKLSPLVPRFDWAHLNSVHYTKVNPVSHTPAYLISVRNISTVLLIDAADGHVIWQSPRGLLSLQHDATLTDKGTIVVFDNGLFRDSPFAVLMSRVIEIDPNTNSIVWEFPDRQALLPKIQFTSSIMGGAQRLSNGNTLISLSTADKLLEVTPQNQIVWRYENDFLDSEGTRVIFKSRKYLPQGTAWGILVSSVPSLSRFLCR